MLIAIKPTYAKAVVDAPAAVSAIVVQLVVVVTIAVEVVVVVLARSEFTSSQPGPVSSVDTVEYLTQRIGQRCTNQHRSGCWR